MSRFWVFSLALFGCSAPEPDAPDASGADTSGVDVAGEVVAVAEDAVADVGMVDDTDDSSTIDAEVVVPELPGKTVELRIDGGFDLPDRVARVLALPDGGYAAVLEVSRDARRIAVLRFDATDHAGWTHVSNEATADEAAIDAASVGASVAVLYRQNGARLRVLTPEGTVHADVAVTTPALPTHLGASSDGRLVVLAAPRGGLKYASGAYLGLNGAVLGEVPIHDNLRELRGVRVDRDRIAFVGRKAAGLQALNGALVWERTIDGEFQEPSGGTEAVAMGPGERIAAGFFDRYTYGEWPYDSGTHRVRQLDGESMTYGEWLADSYAWEPGVALAFGPAGELVGIATSDSSRVSFRARRYGSDMEAHWSYLRDFDRGTTLAFLTDGSLVLGGQAGHETPTDAADGLLIHVRDLDNVPVVDVVERLALEPNAPPPGTCSGPPACDDCPAVCGLELLPSSPGASSQERLVASMDVDTGDTVTRLEPETTSLDGWYYGTQWVGGPGAPRREVGVAGSSALVSFGDDGTPSEARCDTTKNEPTYEPVGLRLILTHDVDWSSITGRGYNVHVSGESYHAPGVPLGIDGDRVLALSEGALVLTDYATTPSTVLATRQAPPSENVYFNYPTTHDGVAFGWEGLAIDMRSPTLAHYGIDSGTPCSLELTPLPGEPGLVPFRLGLSPAQRVAAGEPVTCERTAFEGASFAADPSSSRIAVMVDNHLTIGVPGAPLIRSEQPFWTTHVLQWVSDAVVLRAGLEPGSFQWLDPATSAPLGENYLELGIEGATAVGGDCLWSVGVLDATGGSQALYRICRDGSESFSFSPIAGVAGVREPGGPALYVSSHDGTVRALSADGLVVASTTLDSPLRGPLAASPAGLVGRDHRGRVVWLTPDLLTVARTPECTGFVPSGIVGPSPAGLRVVGVEGPPGGAAGAGPSTLRVVDLAVKDGILTAVTVLEHTVTGLPFVVVDADDGALWYGKREWRRIALPP